MQLLPYMPPYDWPQVRDFLARRAMPGIERVDDRGYVRTVRSDGGHAVVSVRPIDGQNELELCVRGASAAQVVEASFVARRTFDLDADPVRVSRALEADALLAPFVRRRPGLRIPGAWDPFECAVRAILGQQVTVAAGRTLAARLVARIGQRIADDADGLTYLFPSPAALASADLDGLGLTRARASSLHALGRAVADGSLNFRASIAVVTAALTMLPGVGSWTAQYVALRALGDRDAFPSEDLVLRKMAGGDAAPFTPRALAARSAVWTPFRGYAVTHLWQAAVDSALITADR